MNFSSASLACTKTTSASPRRAMLSAWPVPLATTLSAMPGMALERVVRVGGEAGLGFEQRQDVAEQAGVLRRSGGGDHDGLVPRAYGPSGDEGNGRGQDEQASAGRHGALLFMFLYRDVPLSRGGRRLRPAAH